MKLSKTLKLTLKNLLLDVKMGEIEAKENTLIFDGEEYGVGTEVFVKDTENEGEVIVAPDGDYTLIEDDEKVTIIIVRDGKIEEIRGQVETETKTPETEVETPETSTEVEAEVIEVVPADESKEEETKDDSRERIEVLETRMAEMASGMTELLNKLAAAEGRIAVLEEKLAKIEAPAADPVEDKPEVETKMSRLSYLRKK